MGPFRCIHPRPLFPFRISSHISEFTKNQSYMTVPQNSAHGDRQRHPTTILLCKSQSSQAALMPKEHTAFIEEAYNAGDPRPRDSVPADPISPST